MHPVTDAGRPRKCLVRLCAALAIAVILAACSQADAPAPGSPIPTAPLLSPSPQPFAQTLAEASVSEIAPTPAPQPTISPVTPTFTPRPLVRLAIPERWSHVAAQLLLNEALLDSLWGWQVDTAQDQADVVLANDSSGLAVASRPLAVAVPFTTEWEATTLDQAREIATEGHALAVVVDWEQMRPWQKALRIDGLAPGDAGYLFQDQWSLVADAGFEAAATEMAAVLRPYLEPEPVILLAAVGDVMLDRALGYAIRQGNLEYPFAQVGDLLQAADFTVGNLESALGDPGEAAPKHYTFIAPSEAAHSLSRAGFDLMSLANNHAMDYGSETLLQAQALLSEAGIGAAGAGASAAEARQAQIVEIEGIRLAFLAYVDVPVEVSGFDSRVWEAGEHSPGLAWADPEQIREDVASARSEADLVIVLLHSGHEYVLQPSPEQAAAASAAVDAGAALVIGHHAHVLQGIQFVDRAVIAYGLGNFAFEIDGDPQSAILQVWLDRHGVRQLELVPTIVQRGGQPRFALPGEAASIRSQVYYLTMILNGQ